MRHWRRFLVSAVGGLTLIGAGTVSVGADEGGTLIEFDSMTPVGLSQVAPATLRNITGGGLPWKITSATGSVDRDGNVHVTVKGLVLAAGPKTPPSLVGTNPVHFFKATVSCITSNGVVNRSTGQFRADMAGDSTINGPVLMPLPHPCRAPEVFVVSPGGAWFAHSNRGPEDDD